MRSDRPERTGPSLPQPRGPGWFVAAPRFLVWEEDRREASLWGRDLASVAPGRRRGAGADLAAQGRARR